MNILFLCHRLPYPPNKGEKIRAFNILAHLARTHKVHLGAFVDDHSDMRHADKLKALVGGECCFVALDRLAAPVRMARALAMGEPLTTSYFGSPRLARWVRGLVRAGAFDRAVLFSTAMAPYLMERSGFDPARVILDMVDVDSDKWRQYAEGQKGWRGWVYGREARTLLKLERRAARAFGATLLVSPFEAQTFAELAPEARGRIHSVPNGVDLDYFSPAATYPNPFAAGEVPIVMTGTMDYRPNTEGVLWFAQEVLPRIRAVLPNARFYAVGAAPPAKLARLAGASTVVTGRVADVRPYLAHARAVVAPLKLARGVQNKVLEAMAMQKPVVATVAATRALDVASGRELWIEDAPERFAASVVAAATGPDAARIAAEGRRHVEAHYDWSAGFAAFDCLLEAGPRSAPGHRTETGREPGLLAGARR